MRAMNVLKPTVTLAMVLAGALAMSGCATKKFVRAQVDPVDARVTQVEKKTAEHTSSISELENSVSRTDEKAQEANKNALAANQAADRANQAATAAGQRADEARNMVQQTNTRVSDLQKVMDNYDNYKLVTDGAVLFKLNSSDLGDEAMQKLDEMAQSMTGMKRYVIEVEGYTDKTGGKQHNLVLSQRRADSVIRYLMTKHNVPLRNIHVIGLGAETPASLSATGSKVTRKEERRVEIKLFAPEATAAAMQSRTTGAPQPEE